MSNENEQPAFENTLSRRLREMATEVAETIATASGRHERDVDELTTAIVKHGLLSAREMADMDDHDPIQFARLVVIDFANAEDAAAEWDFDRESGELATWIRDRMTERTGYVDRLRDLVAVAVEHGLEPGFDRSKLADWFDEMITKQTRALAHVAQQSTTYHDVKQMAAANGWRGYSDDDLIAWIEEQSSRTRRSEMAERIAGSLAATVTMNDPDAPSPDAIRAEHFESLLAIFAAAGFDRHRDDVFEWVNEWIDAVDERDPVAMGENWLAKFRDHGWNPDDEPLIRFVDRWLGIAVEWGSAPMPTRSHWEQIETMAAEFDGLTHGATPGAPPRVSVVGGVGEWYKQRLAELRELRDFAGSEIGDHVRGEIEQRRFEQFGDLLEHETVVDRRALIRGVGRVVSESIQLLEQLVDDEMGDE